MSPTRRTLIAGAAIALLVSMAVASSPVAAQQPKEVRIGFQRAGIFPAVKQRRTVEDALKPRGIEVKWVEFAFGPPLLEALNTGNIDFGYTGDAPPIFAQAARANLLYVAALPSAGNNEAIVVPADSPIKTPADLAGKTVAVNNLANIGDTTIRSVVEKAGGDASKIKFVEVAFPDAEAAVKNKQVDAALILDPFLHSAVAHGERVITYNYSAFDPKLDVAGYFTTGDTITNKPDEVKEFKAAMNKSLVYAQAHPDEVRQIVTTYTKMTADQVKAIVLPAYRVDIHGAGMKKLGDAALRYGTIKSAPDLKAMLP